jgi:hypothetical protein
VTFFSSANGTILFSRRPCCDSVFVRDTAPESGEGDHAFNPGGGAFLDPLPEDRETLGVLVAMREAFGETVRARNGARQPELAEASASAADRRARRI